MSSNSCHVFPLLALCNAVIHITLAANASDIICPDGSPEITDFGDLYKPGSGRLLLLKNDRFQVDGEKVFLSGINTAFLKNGKDFGNGHYHGHKKQVFECFLRQVHSAGGNTMRTFLHGAGSLTPVIENGLVAGLDSKGSFITEVKKYLRTAAKFDIVIFLSLWDLRNYQSGLDMFINDESVLHSYIDNALVPLMKAIKDEPGFGGVDIASGADGMVHKNQVSSNPCYDTSSAGRGRGGHYSMQNILRFVSRQADAIHSIDPDIIVTTELHFDKYVNDSTKFHFTDSCLLQAGGRAMGYLDFYAISSFPTTFEYFKHNATDFPFDKPFVISSFSEKKGNNMTSPEQFKWAYFHGYGGAWSWAATYHFESFSDSLETQLKGLEEIRYEADSLSGGLVAFSLSKYEWASKTLLHPFNSARESN